MKAARWKSATFVVAAGLVAAAGFKLEEGYRNFRREVRNLQIASARSIEVLDAVSSRVEQVSGRLDQAQEIISNLGNLPIAFAETSTGVETVLATDGVSLPDLAFLKRFRGALLDGSPPLPMQHQGELIAALSHHLKEEFDQELKAETKPIARSDRQSLIYFAMLRVNGSMPTYRVRESVPNNLRSIVLSSGGNCSDYTIRLMMVLESIGVKAASVSTNTTTLPGHVFVDAYDPVEDKAYLLDANYNLAVVKERAGGAGFLEGVIGDDLVADGKFPAVEIKPLPVYFRYLDPGQSGIENTPLTISDLNRQRAGREGVWRNWLTNEIDQTIEFWKANPNHAPRTLAEFRKFLDQIPTEFDRSADYAARIRAAAGLPSSVE